MTFIDFLVGVLICLTFIPLYLGFLLLYDWIVHPDERQYMKVRWWGKRGWWRD